MNGIPSLYQMTPTGVPFRTGVRGESTSEQRYFAPGFSTSPSSSSSIPLTPEEQANLSMTGKNAPFTHPQGTVSEAPPSPFDLMSPTEKASYYAENPMMAAVTQGAQRAFGLTSLGMLQAEVNPTFVAEQHNIARGIDPTLSTPLGRPGVVDISPIAPVSFAPENQIANLAMMNQEKSNEPEVSPVDVAAQVVSEISAELGTETPGTETPGTETPGTTADQGGGGGGGGGGEAPGAPGDAPSIGGSMDAAGSNNSGSEGVGSEGASNSYQQGGVASLANRVQDKGRGQDTMLVHMTPKEVGGLQALAMAHGGSLTINPQTGLPEAGFLSSILPMIAGAALTATGIGAPMAALLVGGGYGAATGSLSKGLMAGLGAFGGAGLGSALSAAGAAGAAGATAPVITGTAPALAQAGVVVPQAAMSAVPSSFQAALPGLGVSTAGSAVAPAAISAVPVAAPVTFGNMASGIPALGTEVGRAAALNSLGGPMGAIKTAGMAAAPVLAGGFDEPAGLPVQDQFIRPFKYKARPASEEDEDFRYRTGERGESTGEQRYFGSTYTPVGVFKSGTEPAYGTYAMGGDIEEGVKNGNIRSFDDEYGQDEYAGGGLTAFKAGGLQDGGFVVPADVVAHLGNGSTDAGLRLLAKTLKAKPIKGDGDGMSDSIPTTIGGKQPARVADGEAYISPEVTKKVGSERLYKMMERIRKAKTGKERQAPEINTREYVPA